MHYLGLDVHKETIAVSIAPQHSTEVRRYGIIGGTLETVDNQRQHPKSGLQCNCVFLQGGDGD